MRRVGQLNFSPTLLLRTHFAIDASSSFTADLTIYALSGAHALPSRSTVALHQPAALSSTAARSCSAVSRRRWCFERRRRHCCSLVAPVRESAIFLASRLFSSPANEANSLSFADGCCCATVDETSQKIWPAALQRRCASALTILPALLMARERHASRARPRAACQGREEEHGRRAGVRTHSKRLAERLCEAESAECPL